MAEEKKIAGVVSVQLVDNWRDWKNWWSLKWITIVGLLISLPKILEALPPDTVAQIVAMLPPWAATAYTFLKLFAVVAAAASRVIAQKVPESTGPSVTPPANPPANPTP